MAESLETLIDKATDSSKSLDAVDYTTPVCDRINLDLNGPFVGLRYMATKVKSAHENEALLGLNLIEACVKNCGQRFHTEVGKYRFLNELIKLLSSKYDGDWTPNVVKQRIIEVMYSWSVGLPKETKIAEAYKMLKQQGIITKDPVDPYAPPEPSPTPKEDTIFQDEEKSKLLARLLKSSHPEDLQAANRLIKTMVRQDEMKTERIAKRISEIETCCNNIKLLTEMLNHYGPNSPPQDKELMKELYDSCDKMRPQLFRLASSATEDGDEGLADILKVNDDLSKVLEYYRKVLGLTATLPSSAAASTSPALDAAAVQEASPAGAGSSTLIDLGPGAQSSSAEAQAAAAIPAASSVLENELKALGLHDIQAPSTVNSQMPFQQPTGSGAWVGQPQNYTVSPPNTSTVGVVRPMGQYHQMGGMIPSGPIHMLPGQMPVGVPFQPQGPGGMPLPSRPGPVSLGTSSIAMTTTGGITRGNFPASDARKAGEQKKTPSTSLDLLGQEVMQSQKQNQKQKQAVTPLQEKPPTAQQLGSASTADSLVSLGVGPTPLSPPAGRLDAAAVGSAAFTSTATPPKAAAPLSLENVFVPLDSITPGNHPPLTVIDKNNVRVIFHFAKTSAELPRSDILVVVISTMSSLPSAVSDFVFQAAVPKTMKVKLQPPSGSELPAYNPILPPSAITQVMLIANPIKEKVRLKYKVTYQVNGSSVIETGEVDSFPSPQP